MSKEYILNKVGTDPEIFIKDRITGNFVPAIGLIGGSKNNPIPVTNDGHALQEDNVMVEFNIPPSDNPDSFWTDLNICYDHINDIIKSHNEYYDIAIQPSAEFREDDLKHPQAIEVGCSADFNAWTFDNCAIHKLPKTMRFAGGHIHISYNEPTTDRTTAIIRAMDMFLGIPAKILDKDPHRKAVYGTPGRFRFTRFGCEYRSLSNFWVASKENVEMVFNQIHKAFNYLNEHDSIPQEVERFMSETDMSLVKDFIQKYNIIDLEAHECKIENEIHEFVQ